MPARFTKPAAPPPSGGGSLFDRWIYLFWRWVLNRLENFFPVITSAATNDIIQYNGTDWVNRAYHTFTGGATPSTPGAGQGALYAATSNGHTRPYWIDQDGTWRALDEEIVYLARNTSGSTITKGQAIYITGATGQIPNVALADADSEATLSHGVAYESITNNGFGLIMRTGQLRNWDTSLLTEGSEIYLSSTPGGLTSPAPAAPALRQHLGVVLYSHASQGIILVHVETGVEQSSSVGSDVYAFAARHG